MEIVRGAAAAAAAEQSRNAWQKQIINISVCDYTLITDRSNEAHP